MVAGHRCDNLQGWSLMRAWLQQVIALCAARTPQPACAPWVLQQAQRRRLTQGMLGGWHVRLGGLGVVEAGQA